MFSALDPCVGDGAAFQALITECPCRLYGIEIDANRAEQAKQLGMDTLHANTMDVRCPAEAISLLYLNPPYDLESGQTNNRRLELAFLEHMATLEWMTTRSILLCGQGRLFVSILVRRKFLPSVGAPIMIVRSTS